MHQFFVSHIDDNNLITLPEDEAKHFRVLRLTEKDDIYVTDGKGTQCKVKVKEISKKRVVLDVLEKKVFPLPSQKLIIAIAPTKGNERFEWFLEKAVELGVTDILPFYSKFSERKKINQIRIKKIMVAALKQSMRAYLPKVEEIKSFTGLLHLPNDNSGHYFIAHCRKKDLQLLKENKLSGENICVLIGPEGGFSDNEIEEALAAGWQEVSLSKNRLRTETAALAATLTIKIFRE